MNKIEYSCVYKRMEENEAKENRMNEESYE